MNTHVCTLLHCTTQLAKHAQIYSNSGNYTSLVQMSTVLERIVRPSRLPEHYKQYAHNVLPAYAC
jgi:hypothetical protein